MPGSNYGCLILWLGDSGEAVSDLDDTDNDSDYDAQKDDSESSDTDSSDDAPAVNNATPTIPRALLSNCAPTPPSSSGPTSNDTTPPTMASTPGVNGNSSTSSATSSGSGEKKLTRKRQRNETTWKNVRVSKEYNHGKRYKRGDIVTQRRVGPRCKCKMSQYECKKFTDEQRQQVFDSFWPGYGSAILRQNYVVSHVTSLPKKRQKLDGRPRGDNKKFELSIENRRVQVCKEFFLSTLGISHRMVEYNLKMAQHGTREPAKRGPPGIKISDDIRQTVIDHINSFVKVESHYCRLTTKREYLEATLNCRKMFELYKISNFCHPRVKQHYYTHIFNTEFNLGFHLPSKDLCTFCDKFSKLKEAGELTESLIEEKQAHDKRKVEAREAKEADKDGSKVALTFDLQQVLTCPKLQAGISYYKRKLNVYNFTFYNLATKEGTCYTWHEGECSRGANDFTTCIVLMLKKQDEAGAKHVVLYSDTCGAQNRNSVLGAAIIHFLSQAQSVSKVEQKFFESGHSQQECDSMHSAIERTFQNLEIGTPSDYHQCIQRARRLNPYEVIEITHHDIIDYKEYSNEYFSASAFSGIMKMHHIRYVKDGDCDPVVEMATNIDGEMIGVRYRKRGGRIDLSRPPQQSCTNPVGIDNNKKADLLSLIPNIRSKTIAEIFYQSLSVKE